MILRRDRVIKYENRIATLEADSAAKDARIEFLEKALGEHSPVTSWEEDGVTVWKFDDIRVKQGDVNYPELAAWLREQEKK